MRSGPAEERYRAVVEQAVEGIFLIDAGTRRVLESNPAFSKLMGFTPEELLGMKLEDFVAHDQKIIDSNVRRVPEEGAYRLGERRYRRKDGSLVHVEVSASGLRYGDREVLCCVAHDITGHKRLEETLRESEERYRTFVEQSTEGIWRFEVEEPVPVGLPEDEQVERFYRHGYLAECNDAMARMYGFERAGELEGTRLGDLLPRSESGNVEYLRAFIRSGYRLSGAESLELDKQGNSRHFSNNLTGITKNGSLVRAWGTQRDVTRRKQAEEALQRSLNELLALHKAGQILNSTLESEEIGARLLGIMKRVCNLTAAVVNVRDEHGRLHVWHTVGLENLRHLARYSPEVEAARWAVLEGEQYTSFRLPDPDGRHLVGLCLPLRVRDRVTGVLEVYGKKDLVETDAIGILISLAGQSTSALENARLYRELAEHKGQLQELVGKLIRAQEEERRRVAYEIHDVLTQVAVAAHQHLQSFAAEHPPGSTVEEGALDRAIELAQRTVKEARGVIAGLRPTALDDFGLATAVRLQVEALRAEGWEVEYKEAVGGRLPAEIETAFYRIAQEALTNARKHARTDRISVLLEHRERTVRLEVRDWGRGFDRTVASGDHGPGERVGISSMKERVALLAGDFEISSRPGEGTRVVAEVPLPVPENAELSLGR